MRTHWGRAKGHWRLYNGMLLLRWSDGWYELWDRDRGTLFDAMDRPIHSFSVERVDVSP